MIQYVLGFYFSEDKSRVCLIKKNRPSHLAGKWNGLGGKVEPDEEPDDAMRREFSEEGGVHVDGWQYCLSVEFNEQSGRGLMHVYRAFGDVLKAYTRTDEQVNHFAVDTVRLIKTTTTCQWLVPLLLDERIFTGEATILIQRRGQRVLCPN